MPFREVIRICRENCTKDSNTLCGQNADLLVWNRWCVCSARSCRNATEFHEVCFYTSKLTEPRKRVRNLGLRRFHQKSCLSRTVQGSTQVRRLRKPSQAELESVICFILQTRCSTHRFPLTWSPEGCNPGYEVWWQCDTRSDNSITWARQGMLLIRHTIFPLLRKA